MYLSKFGTKSSVQIFEGDMSLFKIHISFIENYLQEYCPIVTSCVSHTVFDTGHLKVCYTLNTATYVSYFYWNLPYLTKNCVLKKKILLINMKLIILFYCNLNRKNYVTNYAFSFLQIDLDHYRYSLEILFFTVTVLHWRGLPYKMFLKQFKKSTNVLELSSRADKNRS